MSFLSLLISWLVSFFRWRFLSNLFFWSFLLRSNSNHLNGVFIDIFQNFFASHFSLQTLIIHLVQWPCYGLHFIFVFAEFNLAQVLYLRFSVRRSLLQSFVRGLNQYLLFWWTIKVSIRNLECVFMIFSLLLLSFLCHLDSKMCFSDFLHLSQRRLLSQAKCLYFMFLKDFLKSCV